LDGDLVAAARRRACRPGARLGGGSVRPDDDVAVRVPAQTPAALVHGPVGAAGARLARRFFSVVAAIGWTSPVAPIPIGCASVRAGAALALSAVSDAASMRVLVAFVMTRPSASGGRP